MLNQQDESEMPPQTTAETQELNQVQPDGSEMPLQTTAETEGLNQGQPHNIEQTNNLRKFIKKHRKLLTSFGVLFTVVSVIVIAVVFSRKTDGNSDQQLYENQKKLLMSIGCSSKPEMKYLLSLLHEKDNITDSDYEIEDWLMKIAIYQCNDLSSYCEDNGFHTCEPTENGQTNATAIIKYRDRHNKSPEWQYAHRTLNAMNHTQCICKAENSVHQHSEEPKKPLQDIGSSSKRDLKNILRSLLPEKYDIGQGNDGIGKAGNSEQQLYENQKKLLQKIGCSPKPEVKDMLSLLPEKDDIRLGDYEIEERFIVLFQCNDHSSFCGVNVGNCTCEPTENGQTNATAIIKFRDRHINNSEWQYAHRTLNIMNHTECVAKAV